jgi:hypothetical protein
MKKFYIIISILVLASISSAFSLDLSGITLPKNPLVAPEGKNHQLPELQGTQPLYIIFDNFEAETQYNDGTNNGKIIGNLVALMYADSLYKKYPTPDYNYLNYTVRAAFSDATLSKYNLTDFDVAIFPLGDYPLNVATNGGVKVIDKIKEMLDAGKRVMVIGRRIMLWAFYPDAQFQAGKDPVVIDFLTNTLGIDPNDQPDKSPRTGPIATIKDSTYIPFHINGIGDDPIAKGYDYYCNVGYGRNVDPDFPLIFQSIIDVFRLKQNATAIGFSYINKYGDISGGPNEAKNVSPTPGIWVGCRADVGDGKIAMWSIGADVCALPESEFYTISEKFAMDWFTKDLQKPEPWIEFETSKIDFGATLLESDKPRELRFRNFGRKPLTIKKIYMNGWVDDGIFKLENAGPGVLQPNEVRTIKITFRPTEEIEYEDQLIFESDAQNAPTASVTLQGKGGLDVPSGPEISVPTDPFVFKTLDRGSSQIMDFYFESTGTAPLTVSKISFEQNDGLAFNFPKPMNFPLTVPAGEKFYFSVRFAPADYDKVYKCLLKITSNAKTNPVAYLSGEGRSLSAAEGPQITASVDTLKFGGVKPLGHIIKNLEILNTGKQVLKLQTLYFSQNDEDVFSYPSELDNKLPIEIIAGDKLVIPITFKPYTDGAEYFADFGMFTNATNPGGDDFHVYFTGKGDKDGVSVKEISNSDGTLKLKAFPNPASANFTIEINSATYLNNSTINIYDLSGKLIKKIYAGALSEGTKTFNVNSALKSGQYFIQLQFGNESISLPLQIVK